MTECNWNSPHCVLICYPKGGGGKVVANVMGLSTHCLLQQHDSVAWSTEQKWQFQKNGFQRALITGDWTDLDMRNSAFVGHSLDESLYIFLSPTSSEQFYRRFYWHPRFVAITHSEQDFVIITHNPTDFEIHRRFWPQARTIRCTHGDRVINLGHADRPRKKFLDWSFRPSNLSAALLTEITQHEDHITQAEFYFDMRTVFQTDLFLAEVQRLYHHQGYTDFAQCEPYIKKFQTMWVDTVHRLSRP